MRLLLMLLTVIDSLPSPLADPIVQSVTVQIGNLEYNMSREQREFQGEVRYDQPVSFGRVPHADYL